MKGLAVRDDAGRLRRAAWLSNPEIGFGFEKLLAISWIYKVRNLTDEQKEMVKGLSAPSQIDVQEKLEFVFQKTIAPLQKDGPLFLGV